MTSAIHMICQQGLNQSIHVVCCTGGGAHKFERQFKTEANITLNKCDEIECTIQGLNFLLGILSEAAVYSFENVDSQTLLASSRLERPRFGHHDSYDGHHHNDNDPSSSYLLVSIGSGVSILHVFGTSSSSSSSRRSFSRVSGSSIGGGTYWGLCRLLLAPETFEQALLISQAGSSASVDMSVGDIYGIGGYDRFHLPASTVASSFGKVPNHRRKQQQQQQHASAESESETESEFSQADVARSLLVMITQNIGQIAYLNACLVHTRRIIFVGNFLRHNPIASRTLAYAIDFWSKGQMEAQFCVHEGYLGGLGAFLKNVEYRRQHPQ